MPVKRSLLFFAPWMAVVSLAGCGGAVSAPPVPVPTSKPAIGIAGRWLLASRPPVGPTGQVEAGRSANFSGVLQVNGTSVTGVGRVNLLPAGVPLHCLVLQQTALHGTFDAARHLSLTSDPVGSGVFASAGPSIVHLEMDVPDDPHHHGTGTVAVTGDCALASTPADGGLYDAVQGTYTGTVQHLDAATETLTGAIAQAQMMLSETDPDANGQSVINGTAKFTFPACSVTIPVSEKRYGALPVSFGPPLTIPPPPIPPLFLSSLAPLPDASKLVTSIAINDDCSSPAALSVDPLRLGTLTRQ